MGARLCIDFWYDYSESLLLLQWLHCLIFAADGTWIGVGGGHNHTASMENLVDISELQVLSNEQKD